MTTFYLQNARVLDPACGRDEPADLYVRDGVIQSRCVPPDSVPRIDGTGLLVAPGFWDVHVHFRDPGNGAAETRRTGAAAAAAGGFTRVVTMPNTVPAGDTPAWVREQIEDDLPVRILPSACISKGRQGREVADLEALAAAGAAAFTDDGAMVDDDAVMRAAMTRARRLGKPVMDHAVVPALARNGVVRDGPAARRLGLPLFPPEA
ncbi:MAG: amidohydrolase family protein, partial [Kiritimatiellae bacterium]|nr:amidohydrolase family protein [Kiritimatiellia bacterium]MDD4442021.1 amidohydrolase family protein [Kiritimatiellia bacterium]